MVFSFHLSGSARNKALIGLNGQTVATAVRDTLRRAYKKSEIKVSQTASLDQDGKAGAGFRVLSTVTEFQVNQPVT